MSTFDFIVSFAVDAPNAKEATTFMHQLLDAGRISAELHARINGGNNIRVMDHEIARLTDSSTFKRIREPGETP